MPIRQNPRPATLPAVLLGLLFLSMALHSLHAAAPAQPAPETKRFFWKVTSPTAVVYLLGSIHVASPDMYPLPPEIEAAYKASDNLAVEADISGIGTKISATIQVLFQGMYGFNDSLDKHVSPETMRALKKFCDANGLAYDGLTRMKPALVASAVEETLLAKSGFSPDNGIDLHFLNAANASGDKKIVQLESASSQLKLLFSLDDKVADKWLASSMNADTKEELAAMIKAWKEGDVKEMEKEVVGDAKMDPDEKKFNDALLGDRNVGMVNKIDDMLKGKEKSFVVVGAAHMMGEKGIVQQLQAKGYKVERPRLSEPVPATAPASAPAREPALSH